MFNKTIFKQTFKSNYPLWIIFTVVMTAVSCLFIIVYDPKTMAGMSEMLSNSGMGDIVGDRLATMTSILGLLSNSFYAMVGIVLPLIYIIITANSLIASQVDRGSMAYTLSTPIKRTTVVATQAIYLILAIFSMVTVVTGVGMVTAEVAHGGVFSEARTADIKENAVYLDVSEDKLENQLYRILDNEAAVKKGAEARDIDQETYKAYLNVKMMDEAFSASADKLDKKKTTVKKNPTLILKSEGALTAGAKVMDITNEQYHTILQQNVAANASEEQTQALQEKMMKGMAAAAKAMNIDTEKIQENMDKLKDDEDALTAAEKASGVPKAQFKQAILQQLAQQELNMDDGFDFNVKQYVLINLGLFLLLFALSSISFAASSIFNLTKYSMMFGAGIPITFFLLKMISETSTDLESLKYFSLNSLFDAEAIISNGDYVLNFVILAGIGIVLYVTGSEWFKRKDLPL